MITPASPETPLPSVSNEDILVQSLPTISRLALAYAPKSARLQTLALLALDTRLAGLLRNSKEPMLAQLRMSWWRESLGQSSDKWPEGEPVLAVFRSWQNQHQGATSLVNGWEALTGNAPLPASAFEEMAKGRAQAFVALAHALGKGGEADAVYALAYSWGLSDLAVRLGNETERQTAIDLAMAHRAQDVRVSKALRPIKVLQGLSDHRLTHGEKAATSPSAVIKAMRIGLLGF